MPREHIYDPTPRGILVETGEPGPERLRRVSVGWSKDMYVQVGVGWVDPGPVPSGLPAETDEEGRVWQSQWCDMNRHTINDLIRVLRRARDQAFGRDE